MKSTQDKHKYEEIKLKYDKLDEFCNRQKIEEAEIKEKEKEIKQLKEKNECLDAEIFVYQEVLEFNDWMINENKEYKAKVSQLEDCSKKKEIDLKQVQ